jgi:hypothetical protein
MSGYRHLRFFNEVGIDDVASVSGKNASLGEMYQEPTPRGIRVPNGFAITADAYRYVLDRAGAWPRLRAALDGLDINDVEDLARRARAALLVLEPDSGGNALVTCHSAENRVEGQFANQANSLFRPEAAAPCRSRGKRCICTAVLALCAGWRQCAPQILLRFIGWKCACDWSMSTAQRAVDRSMRCRCQRRRARGAPGHPGSLKPKDNHRIDRPARKSK